MASPKAIQFEKDLLDSVSVAKKLILIHIEDSDGRQDLQRAINNLYDRAHLEARRLRKALAYLHKQIETGEPPDWETDSAE